ncbi:uncharacterized protein B0H18DRAFT_1116649 [Fomitopsis serialis]|uniref:uncharacterized protein n=1 Tax=Fomitopsis serialis TaxID=139415 RepID=UPI002008BCF2|nr:uncharacterized protein B0H18DRAFT_1116649 [Neoantrodia serialis]KAH9930949.1 hypothetical protein B0H18DRAFT_1116649 [Neoantrodia serialis]
MQTRLLFVLLALFCALLIDVAGATPVRVVNERQAAKRSLKQFEMKRRDGSTPARFAKRGEPSGVWKRGEPSQVAKRGEPSAVWKRGEPSAVWKRGEPSAAWKRSPSFAAPTPA